MPHTQYLIITLSLPYHYSTASTAFVNQGVSFEIILARRCAFSRPLKGSPYHFQMSKLILNFSFYIEFQPMYRPLYRFLAYAQAF